MPKGVDSFFSNSTASATTLLPPAPRKAVDPNSDDAARGQTFRKALDQAKPKPKNQTQQPAKPRTSSRNKTQNKKSSSSDPSDTPTDPNVASQTNHDDKPDPSAKDSADGASDTNTQDAQATDEKPAKTDDAQNQKDTESEANAAVLASAAVNNAQQAPTTLTAEQTDQAAQTSDQPRTKVTNANALIRKGSQPSPRGVTPKMTDAVKKPMPQDQASGPTDDSDAQEESNPALAQRSEDSKDSQTQELKNAPTKTTPSRRQVESKVPEVELVARPKVAPPKVAKASGASKDQVDPVADLNAINIDAPPASNDDHNLPPDQLAPLEALSALDTATPTAKPAMAAPAQMPQQSAPPPAPEQDFASNNHDRIVTSMRTQLLPNGGTMHLRLDPPELGVLQISVRMVDGAMTASFETSNDQATKLLSHSLGQLKQVLETQGVSVEKLHVQQTPSNQQGSSNNEDRQQSPDRENQSARQEQQRREMLQRMWKRLRLGSDPLDMVA